MAALAVPLAVAIGSQLVADFDTSEISDGMMKVLKVGGAILVDVANRNHLGRKLTNTLDTALDKGTDAAVLLAANIVRQVPMKTKAILRHGKSLTRRLFNDGEERPTAMDVDQLSSFATHAKRCLALYGRVMPNRLIRNKKDICTFIKEVDTMVSKVMYSTEAATAHLGALYAERCTTVGRSAHPDDPKMVSAQNASIAMFDRCKSSPALATYLLEDVPHQGFAEPDSSAVVERGREAFRQSTRAKLIGLIQTLLHPPATVGSASYVYSTNSTGFYFHKEYLTGMEETGDVGHPDIPTFAHLLEPGIPCVITWSRASVAQGLQGRLMQDCVLTFYPDDPERKEVHPLGPSCSVLVSGDRTILDTGNTKARFTRRQISQVTTSITNQGFCRCPEPITKEGRVALGLYSATTKGFSLSINGAVGQGWEHMTKEQDPNDDGFADLASTQTATYSAFVPVVGIRILFGGGLNYGGTWARTNDFSGTITQTIRKEDEAVGSPSYYSKERRGWVDCGERALLYEAIDDAVVAPHDTVPYGTIYTNISKTTAHYGTSIIVLRQLMTSLLKLTPIDISTLMGREAFSDLRCVCRMMKILSTTLPSTDAIVDHLESAMEWMYGLPAITKTVADGMISHSGESAEGERDLAITQAGELSSDTAFTSVHKSDTLREY